MLLVAAGRALAGPVAIGVARRDVVHVSVGGVGSTALPAAIALVGSLAFCTALPFRPWAALVALGAAIVLVAGWWLRHEVAAHFLPGTMLHIRLARCFLHHHSPLVCPKMVWHVATLAPAADPLRVPMRPCIQRLPTRAPAGAHPWRGLRRRCRCTWSRATRSRPCTQSWRIPTAASRRVATRAGTR